MDNDYLTLTVAQANCVGHLWSVSKVSRPNWICHQISIGCVQSFYNRSCRFLYCWTEQSFTVHCQTFIFLSTWSWLFTKWQLFIFFIVYLACVLFCLYYLFLYFLQKKSSVYVCEDKIQQLINCSNSESDLIGDNDSDCDDNESTEVCDSMSDNYNLPEYQHRANSAEAFDWKGSWKPWKMMWVMIFFVFMSYQDQNTYHQMFRIL